MMFEALERRAARAGAAAVARLRARLVAAIDLPDVIARETARGVALSGRGLRTRMRRDPRLRWLGRLVR
jgi:hypothetical protein